MNAQTLKRWLPVILGSTLVGLLIIGLTIVSPALAQGPGMMGGSGYNGSGYGYGSGYGNMMGGSGGYGYGNMPGYGSTFTGTMPYGYGDMMGNGGYGGMMGGGMGMMGGSMMGGFGGFGNMMSGGFFWSGLFKPDPITLSDATSAVETYIAGLNDSNLSVGEVMVFDNHAYAEIVETDTGIGVAEVLIDPVTGSVSPEMGPNLMWNQKYGMMGGGFGGMMGGFGFDAMSGSADAPGSMMDDTLPTDTLSADMPVSATDAVKIAQAYLDNYVPGNLTVEDNADPFYGYYTIHVLRDGEIAGMLSVNGYTRQVFLHTWHGDFVEMSEE